VGTLASVEGLIRYPISISFQRIERAQNSGLCEYYIRRRQAMGRKRNRFTNAKSHDNNVQKGILVKQHEGTTITPSKINARGSRDFS
jgi:hypothetical protein